MAKNQAPKGGKVAGSPKGQQPTAPNGGKVVKKGGTKGGKR
jgi:hypothetical protein